MAYANSILSGTLLDSPYSSGGFDFYDHMDGILIGLYMFLYFGILLFAFLFPTHPGYLVLGFILALGALWILGIFYATVVNAISVAPYNTLPAYANLRAFAEYQIYITSAFMLLYFIIGYGRLTSAAGEAGA